MERKKLWKRGLSFGLAFVMTLLVGLSPLPEGLFTLTANAAEKTFSLPKSDLALGANVVPTTLTGDSSFMDTYVYRGSMSLNSNFKVNSQDYSNKSNGNVLKYTDKIGRDDEGRKWQVWYRWDLTDKQKNLLVDTSYDLRFQGNAISEYHTRTYWYDWKILKHKKAWDRAQIGIKTNRGEIWSHKSKMQDSGTAVPGSWSRNQLYTDFIEFFARAMDCSCGYSAASGNVFYLVDTTVPRITDVYVCSDKNNPTGSKIKDGTSLSFENGNSVTSYIAMEFSEKVRFSDNTGKELSLNIDAYDRNTGVALDAGTIKAKLVAFENNRMIFEYSVSPTYNGKPTDIRISGISSNQKEFANGSFDLTLFDGSGNKASTGNQKSSCYVTDIAGNSIDWSRSDKGLGNIVYDNIAPTMKNVTMNGNMVNSATSKGNVDGVDRSAIFAGVGDWVEFNVYFSEDVILQTSGNMSMVLNIKDADGNPIKVACSQQKDKKRILSSRLNITKDLLAADMAGERIQVVGIEGITKITDKAGNAVKADSSYTANLSSITLKPAQQVFVDTQGPVITTSLTPDALGVYTPIQSSLGQVEYFTFPIKIVENTEHAELNNTSWVEPQKASFALKHATGGNTFGWYVDYKEAIDTNKFQTGTTVATENAKYTYTPVEGTTAYLHLKLDENIDYGYRVDTESGLYFDAEIFVKVADNAGNTSQASFKITQMVDDEKPTGSIDTYAEKSVDYTALISSLSTSFSVKDNVGIKQVSYYWTYNTKDANTGEDITGTTTKETIDLTNSLAKEYTETTSVTIPFAADNDYGRTGSAYLTIEYSDYAGYNGVVIGPAYTYNFTKATSEYTIVGGTKENPVCIPQVYIREPKSSTDIGNNRTVLFIPYEKNEDGTAEYFVYDPKNEDGSTDEATIIYGESLDLIGEVFKYELTPDDVSLPGIWYTATGKIENGAGTFTVGSSYPTTLYRMLKAYIKGGNFYEDYGYTFPGVYGAQEMIIVTSEDFDHNFSFTEAKSTVSYETVYLGNGPKYNAEITAVRDDVSADATEKYCYVAGNVPERDLDNLEIELTLSNITPGEDVAGYGFSLLDFANSKVELLYYNRKNTYVDNATVIYEWPLAEATTQSVVVPADVATELGWYGLRVTLATTDGLSNTIVMNQKYLMDNREREAYFEAYYKSYDRLENGEVDETIKAVDITKDSWDGTSDIEVALDMTPGENWKVNTYFRFGSDYSTIGSSYDIEDNVKFRVYNKNDADYEQNAIWFDVTYEDEIDYLPVYVEEIKAESYGTAEEPILPLYAGDNLISFEIVNTNGDVNYYEIPVYAHEKAYEWQPKVTYTQVSEKTGGIMEATVSPGAGIEVDLANSIFAYISKYNLTIQDSYSFRDDFAHEFYLLDQNGNLTAKNCAVSDIDGKAPDYVYTNSGSQNYANAMGRVFNLVVTAQDAEGAVYPEELILTFDADYSAVLLGLTGEERINNTEQISMQVPINREKDENGNYLPWESYDTDNYGIYRTLIVEEEAADGADALNRISVEVWGTWKSDFEGVENYDYYKENGYDALDVRSITFTALDANGNSRSTTEVYDGNGYYSNYRATSSQFMLAFLDENGEYLPGYNDSELPMVNEDGRICVYTDGPISKIYSYGATSLKEIEWSWGRQVLYQTTLPMISGDGVYTLEYMDLFGDIYQQEFVVEEYGEVGIEIEISETDFTNQPVKVNSVSTLQGDYITSIKGVTEREGDEDIIGIIDEVDSTKASIEMPENGYVVIETSIGKERMVPITNIDKVLEPVTIKYVDSLGVELDSTVTILDEEVTAILVCDEDLSGIEGRTIFAFPRGSKTGDTHTFRYMDMAGNEGTITAVLPCDISKAELEEGFVDTTAPIFEVGAYGFRNNKYEFVTDLSWMSGMNEATEEGAQLTAAYVQMLVGSEGLGSYVSQGYKLMLDIRDETETKLVALKPGSAAPTSYDAISTGSQVENVTVSNDTITISENAEFDLHIIDAYNNVTSVPGIKVTTIDKTAPLYTVTYVVSDDKKSVHAIFVPENPAEALEKIYPLDKAMESIKMESGVTDENGDPCLVDCYFLTFTENGTRTFNYKDEYGNSGKSEASVHGFSTGAAVVTSVVWSGTADKQAPTTASKKVNKDITANLNVSKAISAAALYRYDEAEENGKGTQVTTDAPINISFTSKNVFVTYAANMDKVVVELISAENGNVTYYTLPAVNCIDKTAPVVTVDNGQAVLSEDKRSMTITFYVNEKAVLTESTKAEFAITHTWFTKSNEETILHFTDEAGNVTEYKVTQNSAIDTKVLTAVYSATESHTDESTNPAEDFTLEAGDAIWVKTSKDAKVAIGEESATSVSADSWTKFVLPEAEGIYMIKLTDSNTNEVSYKTLSVQLKDRFSPVITLESDVIVLEQSVSITEMLQKIRSDVSISDNKDGQISTYEVTGYPQTVEQGIYELTYRASDSAGNMAVATRTLYIMEEGGAVLYVNGVPALPFARTVISGHDLSFEVEGFGEEELLTMKMRSGIKSVGQMKRYTTAINNMEATVSEDGFYTIYVRTQDRKEYVTYLYVEE